MGRLVGNHKAQWWDFRLVTVVSYSSPRTLEGIGGGEFQEVEGLTRLGGLAALLETKYLSGDPKERITPRFHTPEFSLLFLASDKCVSQLGAKGRCTHSCRAVWEHKVEESE